MHDREIYLKDRFILYPDAGRLDVVHQARAVIQAASAQVSYRGPDGEPRHLRLAGSECEYRVSQEEAVLRAGNDHLLISWHIGLGEAAILCLDVENRSRQPMRLEDVAVLLVDGDGLRLGGSPKNWSFYQNGWQSWSPTFARHTNNGLYLEPTSEDYITKHLPQGPIGAHLASDGFTVITDRASAFSFLCGFVSTAQTLSEVRLALGDDTVKRFQAVCFGDGATLPPGGRWASENLLLEFAPSPLPLLDVYMGRLAASMGARVPQHIPSGWCTWYYFYGENSEDDVAANVARIKELALPLEYILIDHGYERNIGDWLVPSDKFPRGLPWVLQHIREAGLKPALWVAPFGVAQRSELYAQHPDWALKREDGKPVVAWQDNWMGPILALDCTHPDVHSFLTDLFRFLAEEWDIELFKLDFCYAAALPGRRHDPSSTRATALRRGLEIIREAVGDRFLLGCGLPLGLAVGVVDAMRVGTDVAMSWRPFWPDLASPATANALHNVIARYASHGRLWLNDPDCVMVRRRDDENDLKFNEMRTMVALMGLSGGLVLDGDNFVTLAPGRLKYLQKLLPPSGRAAVPLDLFQNETPHLLALPCDGPPGRYVVLAAVNWNDHTVSTTLDLAGLLGDEAKGGLHAYDLLGEHYLGVVTDRLVFDNHLPHATALTLLRPLSTRPDLLASTFHILGGLMEVKSVTWAGNTLRVELEKAGSQFGCLLFTVPEPYHLDTVRVDGEKRRWAVLAEGIVEIGLTLDGRATVDLEFA